MLYTSSFYFICNTISMYQVKNEIPFPSTTLDCRNQATRSLGNLVTSSPTDRKPRHKLREICFRTCSPVHLCRLFSGLHLALHQKALSGLFWPFGQDEPMLAQLLTWAVWTPAQAVNHGTLLVNIAYCDEFFSSKQKKSMKELLISEIISQATSKKKQKD